MKIGIFGGSFNPIHNGHLFVAESILREFGLDRIFFIPAFVNPFKREQAQDVENRHRFEMVKLAVAGHSSFQVEDFELRKEGPSYTIDTLEYYSKQFPDAQWFLIMGGDSLASFPKWKDAERILELAEIVVYDREGSTHPKDFDFKDRLNNSKIDLPIDISSTLIRSRIETEQSYRYLIPEMVYRYINLHSLYKA